MSASHTPGPWRAVKNAGTCYILPPFGNDDACITSVYVKGNGQNASKNLANARLIAAAPELLVALEKFVATVKATGGLDHHGAPKADPEWLDLGDAYTAAKSAITKAKGQS